MNQLDYIINLLDNFLEAKNNDVEIGEQEAGGGSTGGGGKKPPYPTVTKWESGVARTGPANQIGLTKWRDIVKINRGKANTLL
jgi:hypothetical protein